MAYQKPLSEIVAEAGKLKKNAEKVAFLKQHESIPLRTILKFTYNADRVKFLLPDCPPPWKKNGYVDIGNLLYKETRRLGIFVQGGGYDHISQVRREELFISLLEDIDDNDAELLVQMIQQKPLKGLSAAVVKEAFPQDYE